MIQRGSLSDTTIEDSEGRKYVIGKSLGAGGFGEVYKTIDGFYAVKFLLEYHMRDKKAISRFLDEARGLDSLDHPNIIKLHNVGIDRYTNRIYINHAIYQAYIR